LGVRRRWSPAAKPRARRWIAWGIPAFLVGAEIAARAGCCSAVGAKNGEMLLALKSGNFGGPEFFADALD